MSSSLHSPIYDSLMPRYEDGGQRSSLIKWEFFLASERETGNKCNDKRVFAMWWIMLPYCDITLMDR